MPKHLKTTLLSLSFLSVFFLLITAISTSRLTSEAQTVVIPISPPVPSPKDSVQMGTFGYITTTPKPNAGGGSGSGGSSGGAGGASGPARWIYPQKSPSQYRRIDAGWDLQYHQKTPVFAVASGKVSIAGSNPGGFGVDYPLLTLDSPICGYSQIYYGHVHVNRDVLGKHVNAGEALATTDPNGVNSPSNWTEPGFWKGGPVGNSQGAYPTLAGKKMKSWLLNNDCSGN